MALNIIQWPTNNFGYPTGTHGRNGQSILAIINHIMQGTMAGMHANLANKDSNSATFGISKTGRVEQYVALGDAAWCNGVVNHPNLNIPWIKRCVDQHISPNLVTVSIEHEGYTGVTMPEVQILASIEVHKYVLARCPGIAIDKDHITGHFQIDSIDRPYCPGTAFPFGRILSAVAPAADPWSQCGFGAGLLAYCKAHEAEYGVPFLKGQEVHWDADHDEYAKTILPDGHVFLHVYRAYTREIKTIAWGKVTP